MKRFLLPVVTLIILFATGVVLARAGWLSRISSKSHIFRPAKIQSAELDAESCYGDSDAFHRWRQCQPHHWRTLILKN